MQDGFRSRIIDRLVANARAIRGAPEAIGVVAIIAMGIAAFGFQQSRERLAELNERLATQDRVLGDYRTKLAEYRTKLTEAGTQIEKLSTSLADAEKRVTAAKDIPRSVENRARDPGSLYEDNNRIAQVQDPKIDLDQKTITFPAVSSGAILETNKLYEFQNWKLTCGGTRLFHMVSVHGSNEFSYSPLACKIVANR
jgi:uncharacterized coiled-coil protein SlyX